LITKLCDSFDVSIFEMQLLFVIHGQLDFVIFIEVFHLIVILLTYQFFEIHNIFVIHEQYNRNIYVGKCYFCKLVNWENVQAVCNIALLFAG